MGKVARIAGTLEEVDKYGRDSEMAYQLELRYGELANDEELAIIGAPGGTRQTSTVGTQSAARKFACFQVQMLAGRNASANVVISAATDLEELEEEMVSAHEGAYQHGGNPSYLIVNPRGARYVAGFAGAAGRQRDIRNERRIVNVVDLYVSPFGELDVVIDRHCETDALGVNIMAGMDFQYSATPVLRPTRDWALAKTGDAENRQILRESSYAVLNTDAHFMIDGISDALTPSGS
jgi:hypothetical protein